MARALDSQNPATYDDFRNPHSAFHAEKYRRAVSLVPPENRGRVLEIGAGTGVYTPFLVRDFKSVTATDLDADMVSRLQKKFPKVSARVADCAELPFGDASFDTVFGVSILHHVPRDRRKAVFEEARRVLCPNGFFVLVEPNKFNPGTSAFQRLQREDAISRFEFRRLAKAGGFAVRDVREILFSEPLSQSWVGGKRGLAWLERAIEALGMGVSVMCVCQKA